MAFRVVLGRWLFVINTGLLCSVRVEAYQRHLLKSCSTVTQTAQDADLSIFLEGASKANISGAPARPKDFDLAVISL